MSNILITGANGQLGRALSQVYPNAIKTDAAELDISSAEELQKFDWNGIRIIINAAGYTNVDGAETTEGAKLAWAINDKAVGSLSDIAAKEGILVVHISTAYVFDGNKKIYKETDALSPLGVYAKSKAAGDQKVIKIPKHYVVRTDSVIGEGKNFVRTMLDLAQKDIAPTVVVNQIIRPTFTNQLAEAIKFLIEKPAPFGIYNLTNEGPPLSWADLARAIFQEAKINLEVKDTTYEEYAASHPGTAPRPLNSVLDLTKIESIGFTPQDWPEDLRDYIKKELSK